MSKEKKTELLAPCGGADSITAAVHSGADAVYLGQRDFSARANAKNFSREELQEALAYCHLNGVKVYLALNTVVFDRELDKLLKTLEDACTMGADGIIVQDPGVLQIARERCPELPVHASTQMAVHSVKGVQQLEEWGVRRVVLARELSLPEIREIRRHTTVELEVFVHGALCMCVSGQCYMSSFLGGRSANRGNCAQPCRLPFSASGGDGRDLSLKDLSSVGEVKELLEAGVDSLKIEGRMKRPEYVAAAVSAYRQVLDGKQPELDALEAVFSRSGFTQGYLREERGTAMFGMRTKEDVERISEKHLKQIRNGYRKPIQRIPVSFAFTMKEGVPCTLQAQDADGNKVCATGEVPQQGLEYTLTEQEVRRSLEKLGGSPFFLRSLRAELKDGVTIPASARNALRREAIGALTEKRSLPVPKKWMHKPLALPNNRKQEEGFIWRGMFQRAEQLPVGWYYYCREIILHAEDTLKHLKELEPYKEKVLLAIDRIGFGNEKASEDSLQKLKGQGFTKLFVQNQAHLKIGRELGFTLHGSWSLNLTNSVSIQAMAEQGLQDTLVSPEMTLAQIRGLQTAIPLGGILYGRMPLMLTRNCPLWNTGRSCSQCGGRGMLTDRKQKQFPVLCRQQRYTEIYNSAPIYLADRLEEMQGLDFGLFLFTTESRQECESILEQYKNRKEAEESFTRGLYFRNIK